MYNLPFLLDLLKVLNLSLPDKTAFEEAHLQFGVHGEKVMVNQLSLIGNAISLNGQGTVNLNGTDLNLDFYSVMGRLLLWMPSGLDKIPGLISKQLLKIKVRGTFTSPHITKEPVPAAKVISWLTLAVPCWRKATWLPCGAGVLPVKPLPVAANPDVPLNVHADPTEL